MAGNEIDAAAITLIEGNEACPLLLVFKQLIAYGCIFRKTKIRRTGNLNATPDPFGFYLRGPPGKVPCRPGAQRCGKLAEEDRASGPHDELGDRAGVAVPAAEALQRTVHRPVAVAGCDENTPASFFTNSGGSNNNFISISVTTSPW